MSFNQMGQLYDETRIFDAGCFNSALDYLVERFPPSALNKLFEPGIGTGRIAIPLAERGYQVTGVDISEEMLELLSTKLMQMKQSLPISFHTADVVRLPFPDDTFDIAVCVHLFYFVRRWKKAVNEILRVLKQDGPLVLMHTGTGAEVPALNTRYRELCLEQGYVIKDVGVKSTSEVLNYLIKLGCNIEEIRDRWQWTQRIQLDRALHYMKSRAYSFTTFIPEKVHSIAIEKLESELHKQYDSLNSEVEIANQIYLIFISRP
jgi:ubiquinone/menaquinone biosynthesis C-methylase UbiE